VRYRFAGTAVDTDTYELRVGGRVVDVEPQVFDVLAHLIAHRDRVVTKEELLDTIWRFVSESALTTRIKQVRQSVGDDSRGSSAGSARSVASPCSTSGAAVCPNVSAPGKHHRSNSEPTTCEQSWTPRASTTPPCSGLSLRIRTSADWHVVLAHGGQPCRGAELLSWWPTA
jgi:hypothetical protein